MTDSSDPTRRSSRRSPRKPPTIDLKATVVDDGAREEARTAGEGAAPAEAGRAGAVQDAMLEGGPADAPSGEPDRTGPESAIQDPAIQDPAIQDPAAERPSAEEPAAEEPSAPQPAASPWPEAPPRGGPGLLGLAGAGLLGGLVGAVTVLAFEAWRPAVLPGDPRVERLERQLAALPRPDVAALERRLAAVESAQNGLAVRAQAAQAAAERAAARAEEAMNRPLPAPAAPPPDDAALADLGSRLAAAEAQLREEMRAASGERQAIRRSADAAARAVRELGERVSAQDGRIAALVREAAAGGGEAARAGTRLVLANRLEAALKDGAAYEDVLAGLRRLGTDAALIAPLEPFAKGGAPGAASFAQSFKPLARRMATEARPAAAAAPAGESWTDRLLDLAGRVVTIRAVDAPRGPEGQAPAEAPAARVEEALARGDFAAASAAFDALPEPARALAADWGRELKQRAAADAAAKALAADAVAALNSPTR